MNNLKTKQVRYIPFYVHTWCMFVCVKVRHDTQGGVRSKRCRGLEVCVGVCRGVGGGVVGVECVEVQASQGANSQPSERRQRRCMCKEPLLAVLTLTFIHLKPPSLPYTRPPFPLHTPSPPLGLSPLSPPGSLSTSPGCVSSV